MKNDLYVFLDESGIHDKNKVSIIGALALPNDIYHLKVFEEINQRLRSNEFKIHFTKYNQLDKKYYERILRLIADYSQYMRLNCILYKKINYSNHSLYNSTFSNMIYSKLPERAIYGVVRFFGAHSLLNVTLLTEFSSAYENINLESYLKNTLNIHSIYRNKNYKIIKSKLISKNTEIGVEITDFLIGILRFIILNAVDNNDSKTNKIKMDFICNNIDSIQKIFKNLHVNELEYGEFNTVDVNYYIGLFIGKYFKNKRNIFSYERKINRISKYKRR